MSKVQYRDKLAGFCTDCANFYPEANVVERINECPSVVEITCSNLDICTRVATIFKDAYETPNSESNEAPSSEASNDQN